MSEWNKRSTDPLVIEMHGMLQRLDQKMDDTQRWFKSAHESHLEADKINFNEIKDRLDPIETSFKFLKALAWPAGIIVTPTLAWAGYILLERIKH